jgi:uncharacterized membrane protein HdeD (DUF308 family)
MIESPGQNQKEVVLKSNVGSADRAFRIILGIVLILLGAFVIDSGLWTTIFLVVGILMLLTGLTGLCLGYVPFKIDTTKKEQKPPEAA